MGPEGAAEARSMKACAIKYGEVYNYTIPSFSVIKVTPPHCDTNL